AGAATTTANEAKTGAGAAVAAADQARTVAEGARTDAGAAVAAAGTATTTANEAKTGAGAAVAAADQARTVAEGARTDAGAAVAAAGAATTTANEAKTNAGAAVAAADQARTVADGARTEAVAAVAVAGAATTTASEAKTIAGGLKSEVDIALATAKDARTEVAKNADTVTSLVQQVHSGEVGLVRQEGQNGAVVVAKDSGGDVVKVTGTSGDRRISGVARGNVTATSTDAINGSQYHALTQSLDQMRVNSSNTAIDGAADGSNAAVVAKGSKGVAVGANANSQGRGSVAVGAGSRASGDRTVAIGEGASAIAPGSVAVGQGSQASRANTVSVGASGAERQITNVASATHDTDAVNLRQTIDISNRSTEQAVRQANNYTDGKLRELRRDVDAGTAAAIAIASMPQVTGAGEGMFSLGTANYAGQSALAFGVSSSSQNGRWVFKASGSTTTRGEIGIGAGVGYRW
ncbi:MAG: YadA family autotransporter adhesin, partial [Pseudomonadales bacterium]